LPLESDRIAEDDPQHADEADGAEAHHHHADHALGLDEASVEERETGVISSTRAAQINTKAVFP
jgi:metal-dependent hydrolase (beta-lactamase superfamily II)